ncbi:MAG: hypothetical protein U0228_35210 [Myxococcaceae bacterium]
MLELVALLVVTQSPVTLQALVPTSGAKVEALLDGKADTGWTPEGDAEGEGVLFRFDGAVKLTQISVQACAGKRAAVRPYVNGNEGDVTTVNDKPTPVSTSAARSVKSVFIKFNDASGNCLAEVRFKNGDKDLQVAAPRTLTAVAKASSVLAPADAYHPGYLFDGRLDFGWVEGVKGPGIGESMTLTFAEPVTLAAVELWNGYQRSDDHFKKNARAKKVTLTVDGAPPVELAVKDAQGAQKLALPKPTATRSLTLTINEAWPGSKYDDLVLSELRVWDEQGPRSIATTDLAERAAALKKDLGGGPLAPFVDSNFHSVCTVEGYEFELKFRTNHTFVVYRSDVDETGSVKEIVDGTWIVKNPKTLELFGRSHKTESGGDPYASASEKETVTIMGGTVNISRVRDLSKDAWAATIKKFTAGPLQWSYDCDAVKDFEALSKQDAYVLEGRAVTAIVTR